MKLKKILTAGIGIAAAFAINGAVMADDNISVYVDNVAVASDQAPVIISDRTMVPIRAVFEKAGAQVDWNDTTKTATIKRGDYTVLIKLNQPYIYKNSVPVALDVPSAIVNDRIVIPVRAIAEAMDFGVTWNPVTKSVLIATNGVAYRPNAQWETGFREINKAGLMIDYAFENLQIDLDGDGSAELISFTPSQNGQPAYLNINGSDFSNMLPTSKGGVISLAVVDTCSGDNLREIAAIEGDDIKSALFFRFVGQELSILKSNGSDDGTIEFIDKLFFDGIENIISDIDGICFTSPMVCTSLYSLEGNEIKRYSLRDNLARVLSVQLSASYDDQMTYNIKYTDKYEKGKYADGSIKPDEVVNSNELPHNLFTINNIECNTVDPSVFEIYITFKNGKNAVIWPYSV